MKSRGAREKRGEDVEASAGGMLWRFPGPGYLPRHEESSPMGAATDAVTNCSVSCESNLYF